MRFILSASLELSTSLAVAGLALRRSRARALHEFGLQAWANWVARLFCVGLRANSPNGEPLGVGKLDSGHSRRLTKGAQLKTMTLILWRD